MLAQASRRREEFSVLFRGSENKKFTRSFIRATCGERLQEGDEHIRTLVTFTLDGAYTWANKRYDRRRQKIMRQCKYIGQC